MSSLTSTRFTWALVFEGLLLSAVLILLRLIWMYPGAWVANTIRRRLLHQSVTLPSGRAIFIVGWTGMRGVVSLAAAISLPVALLNKTPFPQRGLIIFLTFCVIFVTLVLQGLTLPPLIRHLGLTGEPGTKEEEKQARRAMAEATVSYLEYSREAEGDKFAPIYDELIRYQRRRLNILESGSSEETSYHLDDYQRFRELSSHIRSLQRATILHMRNGTNQR